MSRFHPYPVAMAVALALLATSAGAQTPAEPAIEPGAIEALKAMGAYLRSIKTFQVDAVTTDEKVLDDGQEGITGAIDLGPSVALGTTCQQYAFREADIDWQIWIQKGDNPLPRKLVITTKTDEARPQHTATFTWNLAPSFNDESFVFNPPEGTGRVVLEGAKLVRAVK